jgi:predicted MFS family arabinose efflux permease
MRSARGGVLVATCVSALIVNATFAGVSVLLPAVSADVGVPVAGLHWAVTGYALAAAAMIVTARLLGDVFGQRRVYLLGLAIFMISSAWLGLTGAGWGMIAGRVVQGAAGAAILACGIGLLAAASPAARQVRRLTWWGGAAAAGLAVGPLAAGALVEVAGWHGVFWIVAGLTGAVLLLARGTIDASPRQPRTPGLDIAGSVLVAAILVPFVLGVTKGRSWGWLSSGTLLCVAATSAAICAFVLVERRAKAPLVEPRLLGNRVLVGATLALMIGVGTVNALVYLVALYLQDPAGPGLAPLAAGLVTLSATASLAAVAPLVTRMAVRTGAREVIAIGSVIAVSGLVMLGFAQTTWRPAAFLPPLVAVGAGAGLVTGAAVLAAAGAVPAGRSRAASSISNLARNLGVSTTVAAATAVYAAVPAASITAGTAPGVSLTLGVSRGAGLLAAFAAGGVWLAMIVTAGRHRPPSPRPADDAATAASAVHTVPLEGLDDFHPR